MPCKHLRLLNCWYKLPKDPTLRTKPARASAFIGVYTLLNADALAAIAMPARASAFNNVYNFTWFPNDKLLGTRFQNAPRAFWAEARKGFCVH